MKTQNKSNEVSQSNSDYAMQIAERNTQVKIDRIFMDSSI